MINTSQIILNGFGDLLFCDYTNFLGLKNRNATKDHKALIEHNKSAKQILIIDDEEVILRSGELALELAGYKVVTAKGGKEAFEYLMDHADSVGLILLDLMMNDIYGINLLERFKANTKMAGIPVVIQSAMQDKSEINRCFSIGAVLYLRKPYSHKKLLDAARLFCQREQK